jgi:hypothetical protein
LGTFYLDEPKNAQGRFRKTEPPTSLSGRVTNAGPPDFYLFGFDSGPLCIECKNYREWTYPHHDILNKLIIKAVDLDATPVLISRRLHYTTITNFLEPAGIIAHESLYHYYPSEYADLAAQVRHRRSLGFTDVLATEDPHKRTVDFFQTHLPRIHSTMAARFQANKQSLIDYATNKINLAELYTAIDSPAGGKWLSPEDRAKLFADYLLPNDDDDNT